MNRRAQRVSMNRCEWWSEKEKTRVRSVFMECNFICMYTQWRAASKWNSIWYPISSRPRLWSPKEKSRKNKNNHFKRHQTEFSSSTWRAFVGSFLHFLSLNPHRERSAVFKTGWKVRNSYIHKRKINLFSQNGGSGSTATALENSHAYVLMSIC